VYELKELPGLEVEVKDVVYMPSLEAPSDRPHPFVYVITVMNRAHEAVTIRARKWVVDGVDGQMMVVEAEGVVGQKPRLEPGESFTYNSYHAIAVDSMADGAFFCETDSGERVFVRIPRFRMRVPRES
jgi:ApaG protein